MLAEEFARVQGAAARRLLRRHAGRPDDPAVGHRGAEAGVPAPDPAAARCAGARASASRTAVPTWPASKTSAVLDGDEWVINGQKVWTTRRPVRRLLLPAHPHRPGRDEAPGHLVPAGADAAGRASRCAASPSPTARPSSARSSSTDARCPQDNVVGGVNNGWKVANSTLAFERGMSATDRLPPLRGGVPADGRRGRARTARSTTRSSASAWPRYYTKIQILRINGLRSLSSTLAGRARTRRSPPSGRPTRCSGPRCTSGRWSWRSTSTAPSAMLVDAGPASRLVARRPARDTRREGYPVSPMVSAFFFSRSRDDLGRHRQIQRNIVGERVARPAPKEPPNPRAPRCAGWLLLASLGNHRASSARQCTAPTIGGSPSTRHSR